MTDRPVLYLLPGLLSDSWVWEQQAQALGADYDVRTPGLFDFDSLEGMARSVLAAAPDSFALAGHSMGGRVAMEVLALAPERVERLALLDTGAHPPGPAEQANRMGLVEIARTKGMAAMAKAWLPPMVGTNASQAVMDGMMAMVRRANPEIFAKQQTALLTRPDGFTRLPLIRGPAAFICGENDAWSPPAQHHEMAAVVPGATVTVIEGCGHMATIEAPEAVTAALRIWLAR